CNVPSVRCASRTPSLLRRAGRLRDALERRGAGRYVHEGSTDQIGSVRRSRGAMAKSPNTASGPVSDGHPSDSVHYREYKLILRPDRFTSPAPLHAFTYLLPRA